MVEYVNIILVLFFFFFLCISFGSYIDLFNSSMTELYFLLSCPTHDIFPRKQIRIYSTAHTQYFTQ